MSKGTVHLIDHINGETFIVINNGRQEYYIPKNKGHLEIKNIVTKYQRKNGDMSLIEIHKIFIGMLKYKSYTQRNFEFKNDRLYLL